MLIMRESCDCLNVRACLRQSCEDCSDVSALLHRNDSELILFIDPDKEGLLIVVEDTTTFRPFTVKTASFEESVTLFKEEVIGNQLLLLFGSHR